MEDLSRYPFWFKVVEMLQQNWAAITPQVTGVRVVFFSDASGIFDEIGFDTHELAEAALTRNGFRLFDEDEEAQRFIARPGGPFVPRPHPNGPIYSGGRFWR